MIVRLKTLPFHCFLISLFYIIHVNNEYFGLVSPSLSFFYWLIYTLLSAALLFCGWKLLKSAGKSAVWTTALMIAFLFFGAAHDFIKSLSPRSFLTSYTFLLPLIFFAFVWLTIYLKRSNKSFARPNHYFNALWSVLLVIESIMFLSKMLIATPADNNFAWHNKKINTHISTCADCQKPDIFFIVFDEYSSSLSLKENFNFDNSRIDSVFKANGFYIATHSKSNYIKTPLSIASTFNMDYCQNLLLDSTTTLYLMQIWHTLKMNTLPDTLAEYGYRVLNYGFGDFNNYPAKSSRFITPFEEKTLYLETLWGRIEKDILWNLGAVPVVSGIIKNRDEKNTFTFIKRNKAAFDDVMKELKTRCDQPRFVFTHIMMPHAPFILNRYGNIINDSTGASMQVEFQDPKRYLEQLEYTNSWIDILIKQAVNMDYAGRPRVVIIEGDHGFRYINPDYAKINKFRNLNCYFFSDKDYSLLYDSISPVNTFRVILNKYFNAQLPILKDSCISN